MNTSILIRTDKTLKDRFEAQAKRQGLSMTFLLRSFMETYSQKPEIIKVGLDEEMLDTYWKLSETAKSLEQFSKTLTLK